MPTARKYQISVSDTPYYHCISRCVRRAFLCGEDKLTGKSYEHRKQWVADKLSELASIFAIDVCAYAIMSNHTHTVLKINVEKSSHWSKDEVIQRWSQLFSVGVLIERYQKGDCHTQAERNKVFEQIEIWRERLTDISWFMRCLNEFIARKANKEDNCTGRFWEGRFKSQALLDEQALLACMVYVDLNPVRAGISKTLEDSEFTSIAQRIGSVTSETTDTKKKASSKQNPIKLAQFSGSSHNSSTIPFRLIDYFELADYTGRAIRDDSPRGYSLAKRQFTLKSGYIPSTEPKLLQKLGINTAIWLETLDGFNHSFFGFVGSEEKMDTICKKQNKKWLTGIQACRRLFSNNNQLSI